MNQRVTSAGRYCAGSLAADALSHRRAPRQAGTGGSRAGPGRAPVADLLGAASA